MEVTLTPETITAIKKEFIANFKAAGLVLVPEVVGVMALQLDKNRKQVMRRNHVSTHTIEKYQLIDKIKTRQSVVNMMKRGELKQNEDWFFDASGKRQVLTIAIKRLNGE